MLFFRYQQEIFDNFNKWPIVQAKVINFVNNILLNFAEFC